MKANDNNNDVKYGIVDLESTVNIVGRLQIVNGTAVLHAAVVHLSEPGRSTLYLSTSVLKYYV